jgi:hypothetical protein
VILNTSAASTTKINIPKAHHPCYQNRSSLKKFLSSTISEYQKSRAGQGTFREWKSKLKEKFIRIVPSNIHTELTKQNKFKIGTWLSQIFNSNTEKDQQSSSSSDQPTQNKTSTSPENQQQPSTVSPRQVQNNRMSNLHPSIQHNINLFNSCKQQMSNIQSQMNSISYQLLQFGVKLQNF